MATAQPPSQGELPEAGSNTQSPFAFTTTQLYHLIDPKNLSLLKSYGGINGLIKGLHADPQAGLNKDETAPFNPVTFKDIEGSDETALESEENVQQVPFVGPPPVEGTPFYQRIKAFGKNVLPEKKPKSIFQLMWIAMQEKVLILLTIAAIVSLGLGLYEDFGVNDPEHAGEPKIRWVEGVAIIIAILIVVMVGSLNDWQKEKQFQKLNAKKEDREVKVIRSGNEALISVHDILVGDVLHMEPGDIIASDGVLIAGHNLRCDESGATGESDAVRKWKYEDCLRESEKGSEGVKADPFILSGSKVLEGVGTYLVTGVGVNSFHGKIMMSLRHEPEDTPLQVKLNDLAERIAKLGGAAALAMFIVLLIKYFVSFRHGVPPVTDVLDSLIKIVISTVTVIVVAVPEGLPLAVTLALAYATTRMLRDNNLVRVLSACETMGNATTVCSDKTGTLTQNKMTVVAGSIGLSVSFVRDLDAYSSNLNNSPRNSTNVTPIDRPVSLQQLKSALPESAINLLNESIAINSTAFEGEPVNGKKTFVGSKTETALLGFLLDLNLDNIKSMRENANIQQLFPFSSERKAMGVVVKIESKYRFYVKGASEFLLQKAKSIVNFESDDNTTFSVINLTEDHVDNLKKIIEHYAFQSLRTIGLAYRDFDEWPPRGTNPNAEGEVPYEELADKITLLGIVGIEDPLREGVREAVQQCVKAGVFVRMVTGDNVITAKSIATQCGIFTDGEVMEGPKFRKLSPGEMDKILPRLQVLARSSPEDKKILVGRLRELGQVVAVTGDGTNDGPALKLSDVGFSMGIAGTEVAKEASSIILMDDNFSSIVKAIMWGRSVNDAVKKFLQFQLTVNVTAVFLTFITAVSSSTQESILSPVQLLWVNLIMDTFAALALATDPPTPDLLDRNPEPRNAPLISLDMWKMILGQSIFQLVVTLVLYYAGAGILDLDTNDAAQHGQMNTIIFNSFVFLQIFNEINSRRLDHKLNILKGALANKFLMIIFVIMVVGQIIIVQFGREAFKVQPLSAIQWLICVAIGFLSIPVGVIIRLIPTDLVFCGYRQKVTVEPPAIQEKELNETILEMQNRLKIFKTLRGGRFRAHFGDRKEKSETRSKAFAAATMLSSLVSASIGAPMTTENINEKVNKSIDQLDIPSLRKKSDADQNGPIAGTSENPENLENLENPENSENQHNKNVMEV